MTSGISTHLPSNKDKIIGRTFRQKHMTIPIPAQDMRGISDSRNQASHPHRANSFDPNMAKRNIFTKPKISSLARDTFGCTRNKNYDTCEDHTGDRDALEHISDRLCRVVQLMKKPKYSRNNSKSNLSDYVSSPSSSVKITNQTVNPSCGCITCI